MAKQKFFIKKWYFWVVVFVGWLWVLILTDQISFLDYPASLIGCFITIFIIWLCVWFIVKMFMVGRGLFKKKSF